MCVFFILLLYIIRRNPGYIEVTRYIYIILLRDDEINYKQMFTKSGQKLTSILKFNCE